VQVTDVLGMKSWLDVLSWTLAVVLLRSLPAALWLSFGTQHAARRRVAALAALALACALVALVRPAHLAELPYLCGGLLYFAVLSLGVHWLGAQAGLLRLTKPALFLACALAFVLVPALAVRSAQGMVLRMFGFEIMLSAYSYLADVYETGQKPTRAQALFFLLVNPTLVFTDRGRPLPAVEGVRPGTSRVLLGALSVAAGLFAARSYALLEGVFNAGGALLLAVQIVCTYFATYWTHAGVASVQIGWMRLLGWQVPERYDYPFLATHPLDYWRRWNMYFGGWLRRYVFGPAALTLRRRHRGAFQGPLQAAALVATFAFSGLLHDYARYASTLYFPIGATLAFASLGAAIVLWEQTAKRASGITRLLPDGLRRTTGQLLVLCLVAGMQWLMAPSSGGRLQPAIRAALGL
jgi:hypothetical protein